MISLLATLLSTQIFYHNPTRTLLGVKKPYSLGPAGGAPKVPHLNHLHPISSHQACGKKLYNRGLQRMEAMLYAMDR